MDPIDATAARELLEAIIAAFSVLGGGMACFSGFAASQALAEGQAAEHLAHRVNEGIAEGFDFASPLSIVVLIIVVWT